MARYFHGIVNRFSAGSRVRAAAASFLQRSGVSRLGTQQFLDEEVVSSAADRQALAGIVGGLLDGNQKLLPAVQSVRGARNARRLHELGLSVAGTHQFLSGLPVVSKADREALGRIVFEASAGAAPAHSGGMNQLKLDDTAGKGE